MKDIARYFIFIINFNHMKRQSKQNFTILQNVVTFCRNEKYAKIFANAKACKACKCKGICPGTQAIQVISKYTIFVVKIKLQRSFIISNQQVGILHLLICSHKQRVVLDDINRYL